MNRNLLPFLVRIWFRATTSRACLLLIICCVIAVSYAGCTENSPLSKQIKLAEEEKNPKEEEKGNNGTSGVAEEIEQKHKREQELKNVEEAKSEEGNAEKDPNVAPTLKTVEVPDYLRLPAPPIADPKESDASEQTEPKLEFTVRQYLDAKEKEKFGHYQDLWMDVSGKANDFFVKKIDDEYHFYTHLDALTDEQGQPIDGPTLQDLICRLDEPEPWKKMSHGSLVTLRCRNTTSIYFDSGTIIQTEGEPCPEITAEQFAHEFEEDALQAKKKYDLKSIVLSGTVEKIAVTELTTQNFIVRILLRGSDQNSVGLCYSRLDNRQFESLRPGDKTKVIGTGLVTPDAEGTKLKLGLTFVNRLDVLKE